MAGINIPVGISDFEKIRRNGYYYVDKTGLIPELLKGEAALVIPNEEIREIFATTIKGWFEDTARAWNRKKLFAAVWSGDCETITGEMNRLLRQTISYHDYKEDFYHAFLAGIFAGAGYEVESNREHGEGRSDIIIYAPADGKAAVFEAKYSKRPERMQEDCAAADSLLLLFLSFQRQNFLLE